MLFPISSSSFFLNHVNVGWTLPFVSLFIRGNGKNRKRHAQVNREVEHVENAIFVQKLAHRQDCVSRDIIVVENPVARLPQIGQVTPDGSSTSSMIRRRSFRVISLIFSSVRTLEVRPERGLLSSIDISPLLKRENHSDTWDFPIASSL